MALFTVPWDFQQSLKRFDPALRCRWSDARACYLIERKVSRGRRMPVSQDPETGQVWDVEAARAYMDGYQIVMEVGWNALDSRVFCTLYESDIWRQGGAEVVNRKIDEKYHAHERNTRVGFNDMVRQEAKWAWKYNRTVRTLPENACHTGPIGGMSINGA